VPELVTIGGPSGIGKSSIIATALKTLQQRTVLLAVGKVDQFSPSLPYGVLSSAFRTLTLHLLGLPADEVAKWKIRLSRALEGYEALAVSLVPELGLLLESKPRFSADTFSIDARARFSHMVLALVKTFASQGCPLVLVLDDLQWSDAASLQTLNALLVNCGAIPLLVVVAHRDIGSLSDATLQRCWRACRRRRKRERDCPAGAFGESRGALAGDGVSHPQRGDDRPRHADPREDGRQPALCA
jgi:predicted ATPase